MKGCFVGSGSEGLQQQEVCDKIIELTRKEPKDIKVCYIGTATYDLSQPKHNQTIRLKEAGCEITEVRARKGGDYEAMKKTVEEADVLLVSGGNTLYATDLWREVKLDGLLVEAATRGAVLTGGSAGAICWFDAGHSDSADPDTYREAMLAEAKLAVTASAGAEKKDESSALAEGQEAKKWDYIRVQCLGLFPGLVCPHADKVQSNGVLRVTDFDSMLLRHRGEQGICIDHFAALCVDGDAYHVLSLHGRPGSVLADGGFSEAREGVPGVWTKNVVDNEIVTTLVPPSGAIRDLLKDDAKDITQDPRLEAERSANPI